MARSSHLCHPPKKAAKKAAKKASEKTAGNHHNKHHHANDVPELPSFTMSEEQVRWAEQELQHAAKSSQPKVLLLHCYPSDLKVGGKEVSRLVRDYDVRLVDMGHAH